MSIRIRSRIWLVTLQVVGLLFTSLMAMPNGAMAAGTESIHGVVKDDAGTPIRGALVKATLGNKTVARYTDKNGQYDIVGLKAGEYDVSVNAYGFRLQTQNRDTSQSGDTTFTLSPQNDITRLTSAEMKYLFPNTKEAYLIHSTCSTCHGLETVLTWRGMTESSWKSFLPVMTVGRWGRNFMGDPERVALYAATLEKIFGANGTLSSSAKPDLSKVSHIPVSDAALQATITEYKIPSPRSMAHSVTVDSKTGTVWFSEYDAASNHMARFYPETEKFEEFPIPVPKSLAHTGTVLKDGGYLVGLDRGEVAGKIAGVDRAGTVAVYEWPEKPQGARMVAVDPIRENIVWAAAGDEVWSLDVKTKKFKAYKNPVPETFPEGSVGALTARPGEQPRGNGYSIAVDSKGFPWVSQLDLGIIFRLDPNTGQTKIHHDPQMRSARGIAIDAHDTVWFADYYGNKLGKLDPKTGQVKLYQPPTPNASPYGVTVDFRRGNIWIADTVGNNITRFDPNREQFVEYPLPTRNTSVRFIGVDPKGRVWYGGFWNGILGTIDPGNGNANLRLGATAFPISR